MSNQQMKINLYYYKVRIVDVIDGDSIRIDIDKGFDDWKVNENVRMLDLNAPEIRTKDLVEKSLGLRSKAWVEDKVRINGEYCIIESHYDKSGKYGRILATFWLKDVDGVYYNLNELMLSEGFAEPY